MAIIEQLKRKVISVIDPQLIEHYNILTKDNKKLREEIEKLETTMEKTEHIYNKSIEETKELKEENKMFKEKSAKVIMYKLKNKLEKLDVKKLEALYNRFNYEDKYLDDIYKDYSASDREAEIYFSKGSIINEESKKLLGDKEIWELFPEEDARGTFEGTNGYSDTNWREKYYFGKIIDSKYIGCYEFCKYKIEENNPKYIEYKKKLYINAINMEMKKYANYIIRFKPDILIKPERYIENLNTGVFGKAIENTYVKNSIIELDQEEENEDSEEM